MTSRKSRHKGGLESYFLLPGELCFTSENIEVNTVLGSCVTVTMFSSKAGLAAACHAVLPSCRSQTCLPGACLDRGRYVTCVLPEMMLFFKERDVRLDEIEIKVFGGADMMIFRRCAWGGDLHIGRKNVGMAWDIIRENQLRVMSCDVGGTLGRKLSFDTRTGEVLVTRLGCIPTRPELLVMHQSYATGNSNPYPLYSGDETISV